MPILGADADVLLSVRFHFLFLGNGLMSQDVAGTTTVEGGVEALTEVLAAAIGTATKLHLFKQGFSPAPTSVEADFEAQECDFSGYAAASLTFGAVGIDNQGPDAHCGRWGIGA